MNNNNNDDEIELVKDLLEKGVRVGNSFFTAVQSGLSEIIHLLLNQQIDPISPDNLSSALFDCLDGFYLLF